ncbi:uncharacterized protein DUF2017 [Salana multivorans]|uniref:Uncharacterized protein DUF2017 n=1 Tax=Salana multivorans TaxID=120377 RepID=A0A3N2DDA0_9MICO|nr:DUF2017 family protein [Salana multivorans]MBN8882370.1 DUF2017 family protein [Salana multivorans]OJX98005.1 MAG: hypothetical protein BGO96_14065 [Micrococcales bacterium 73-15]ROR97648.1 uncharacterized protein DUF2017 [Salana multivorans]
MRAFRRSRDGYTARLDATERTIVARTVADVAALLGFPVDGPEPASWRHPADPRADGGPAVGSLDTHDDDALPPQDPALMRLLPPASEDQEIAGELRRLSEASVRTAKAQRLHAVWHALRAPGEKLVVPLDRAMEWAGALTDVRLVLAERLGIEDEEDAARLDRVALAGPDEVSRALATLYLALSWLQESLLEAMLRDLPDTGAE